MILRDAFAATGLKPPAPVRRIARPAAQPGDEHGAAWRFAGRDRRHAASSLARIHDDLRQARYRRPPLDRAALAGRREVPNEPPCHELDRYLTIRRSLGYDLAHGRTDSAPLRRLRRGRAGTEYHHTALPALAGERLARQDSRPGPHASVWSGSLPSGCMAWTPTHEVPPRALIPSRYRRLRPYIYSDDGNRRDRRGRRRAAIDLWHARR